jgi:hypothetical protein
MRFSQFFDVFGSTKKQGVYFAVLIAGKFILTQANMEGYTDLLDNIKRILFFLVFIAILNCCLFIIVALKKGGRRTHWWEEDQRHQQDNEKILGLWMRSLAVSILIAWFGSFLLMAMHFSMLQFTVFLFVYLIMTTLRQWKTRSV